MCSRCGGEVRFDTENLFARPAPVLVPRNRRSDVPERVLADGTEHLALDEEALLGAARTLLEEHHVEALAVAFLHSYRNPAHERRAHHRGRGQGVPGEAPGVRARRRRDRRGLSRPHDRRRQDHRLRRRRHHRQDERRRGRHADPHAPVRGRTAGQVQARVGAPAPAHRGRHDRDRRGRRLDRRSRRSRPAQGRAPQRGIGPGPGRLRTRGHHAHGHRRRPRQRTPRPGPLPGRRDEPGRRRRAGGPEVPCGGTTRHRRDRGRRRHPEHRGRQHGRRTWAGSSPTWRNAPGRSWPAPTSSATRSSSAVRPICGTSARATRSRSRCPTWRSDPVPSRRSATGSWRPTPPPSAGRSPTGGPR